jgi:hypothetical protein
MKKAVDVVAVGIRNYKSLTSGLAGVWSRENTRVALWNRNHQGVEMRQQSGTRKEPAEKVVRDIRRATRKQYSAEEKVRIVLSGLRKFFAKRQHNPAGGD